MTHTPAQVAARADVGGGVERVEAPPDAAARDRLQHTPEARL